MDGQANGGALGVDLVTLSAFLVLLILLGLLVQGARIDPPQQIGSVQETGAVDAVLVTEEAPLETQPKKAGKRKKS